MMPAHRDICTWVELLRSLYKFGRQFSFQNQVSQVTRHHFLYGERSEHLSVDSIRKMTKKFLRFPQPRKPQKTTETSWLGNLCQFSWKMTFMYIFSITRLLSRFPVSRSPGLRKPAKMSENPETKWSSSWCRKPVASQAPKHSNREFELYPNTCDFFLSYLIKTKYIQRKLRLRTRGWAL